MWITEWVTINTVHHLPLLASRSCFISVNIIAHCMHGPHRQALSPHSQHVTYKMTSWVATAYLSLRMGSIDWRSRVPSLLAGRPAIICTAVRLLWVNMGHLSSSPPQPHVREVTICGCFCLLPLHNSVLCIEMLSCSGSVVRTGETGGHEVSAISQSQRQPIV